MISQEKRWQQKGVCFVPTVPIYFLRLKGIEYLNFMADLYNVTEEERKSRTQSLAERFEMQDALSDKMLSYSHGMRQKIVIMGALIHAPSVWILDEPLTGLDPKSAFALKEMMREHSGKRKCCSFFNPCFEVAEKCGDQIAIIKKGELVYSGTLGDLKKQYKDEESLENIFLEVTK
jgi:ABC-2 type transport system ATP-binding protein